MMRRYTTVLAVLACVFVAVGCEKKEDKKESADTATEKQAEREEEEQKAEPEEPEQTSNGFVEASSNTTFEKAVETLEEGVENADDFELVATVDHVDNAKSVDRELEATTLFLVAQPSTTGQFLVDAQTAGLDLPLKLLVWEADGVAQLGVNAPRYVAARHEIDKYGLQFGQLESQLAELVEQVSGAELDEFPRNEVITAEPGDGIVTVESDNSVGRTAERLEKFIGEEDGVEVMETYDHAARAEEAGVEDVPNLRLILFGNPDAGTQLMQKERSIGVDLPMKYIVYETTQGRIDVAYNDPSWLVERHGIDADEELLEGMTRTLEKVAAKATKESR